MSSNATRKSRRKSARQRAAPSASSSAASAPLAARAQKLEAELLQLYADLLQACLDVDACSLCGTTLNGFMGQGTRSWRAARRSISAMLSEGADPHPNLLLPQSEVAMRLLASMAC